MNSLGGGESDFQTCHIILIGQFLTKNEETHKEIGKYDHIQKEKAINRRVPEEVQMLELLNKDFKLTIIDMFKNTKGKYV